MVEARNCGLCFIKLSLTAMGFIFLQKKISLTSKGKGFHIITGELLNVLPELYKFKIGIVNIFLQHTSASLSINENVSPDVRQDLEKHFDKIVPENAPYYEHTSEGSDDMPAHIKSTMIGQSLTIPISNGKLALGDWQGIYLCEHRNFGGTRKILITIMGEEK